MVVDAEGQMTYTSGGQTYSVVCEYKSATGLKAMTTLEGVKNVKFFEQRSDEIKENAENLESYLNALKDFVLVDRVMYFEQGDDPVYDGELNGPLQGDFKLEDYLSNEDKFSEFLRKAVWDTKLLLCESEAVSYRSLIKQYEGAVATYDAQNIIPTGIEFEENLINENLLSIQHSIYEITQSLFEYIDEDSNFPINAFSIRNALQDGMEIGVWRYTDLEVSWGEDGKYTRENFDSLVRQRNLLLKQLNSQEQNIKNQKELAVKQLRLLQEKKQFYISQIQTYYREYLSLLEEGDDLVRQTPVNFLSDGHYIKGFNKAGEFVALYDRYENYAVIEYETYFDGTTEKSRISRVYDNTEKQVAFTYNEKNQLVSITDVRGRKTCFTYESQQLIIKYDTGEKLTVNCDGDNISWLSEDKNALQTTIEYSEDKPIKFQHLSLKESISVDIDDTISAYVENTEDMLIAETEIMYGADTIDEKTITHTTITDKLVKEKYFFDENLNCIEYRKAEATMVKEGKKYLLTVAEQYLREDNWVGKGQQDKRKEVVISAKRSVLDEKGINEDIFETYDAETTIDETFFEKYDTETTIFDQFNNPTSKETSAILVSQWVDENEVEQETTKTTQVTYLYDDNQKLVQETTTVNYSNPSKKIEMYKKYTYNAYGDVIRTEIYVEGKTYDEAKSSWVKEETVYDNGKTIEETVYDEKGNVIKSFTYNSLSAGSKFYTETEYDENGKVSAELDATGENKTELSYVDGTSIVREELLPNGSKLAYGHDYDDTVTEITQSTENGEENSTQKVYRYGELVEVKSGNNDVKYTYDCKRRITSIELNGTKDYVKYVYDDTGAETEADVEEETVTATYASGKVFVTEKDGKGNLLGLTINGDLQFENVYNDKNQLTHFIDHVASKTYQYDYDSLDRLLSVSQTVDGDYAENITYTQFGEIASRTINTNGSLDYTYEYTEDSKRALKTLTTPIAVEEYEYDCLDRSKKITQTALGKNEIGIEVEKVKFAKRLTYRKVGDHATNQISGIAYLKDGVTDGKLSYTYDNMGNITSVNENGRQIAKYTYDALNRIIKEDLLDIGKEICYTYDNNGNILTKRVNGELVEYKYKDGSDQLVTYGHERFVYDAMGNPTTFRDMKAVWNKGRQLQTITDGQHIVGYTYNGQGLRTSKLLGGKRGLTIGNVPEAYLVINKPLSNGTDGNNMLEMEVELTVTEGATLQGSTLFGVGPSNDASFYTGVNNPNKVAGLNGLVTNDMLVYWKDPDNGKFTVSACTNEYWDETQTTNGVCSFVTAVQEDLQGNIKLRFAIAPNGGFVTQLYVPSSNTLMSCQKDTWINYTPSAYDTASQNHTYFADYMGTGKTGYPFMCLKNATIHGVFVRTHGVCVVNDTFDNAQVLNTNYVTNDTFNNAVTAGTIVLPMLPIGSDKVTYIYDSNGKLIKEVGENTIEYVYGSEGVIGIKVNDVPYLFRKNVFGDVTHIYNESGALVGKYRYTAFGECIIEIGEDGIAGINPIRYRSYYYDDEMGLYYLKTRYYDPVLGRFMTIDDIQYLDPESINGLNLYAYCLNNPIFYIDPSGHFVITIGSIITAALITAGIGAGLAAGSVVVKDLENGKLFDGDVTLRHYIGSIVGGAIAGAGIGLCTVLGAGLGISLATGTSLSVLGTTISGSTALAIGVIGAFVAGELGYKVRTLFSDQERFEWSDMFIEAWANSFSGLLSFVGGIAGGVLGLNVPGDFKIKGFIANQLLQLRLGVYRSKIHLSKIKNRAKELF